MTRLYDHDSGKLLFEGHDIKTLKLHDLRQTLSLHFQDYTDFPLSVRISYPVIASSLTPSRAT